MNSLPRWHVVAFYADDDEKTGFPQTLPHTFDIEELSELDAIIEQGPNWEHLVDIRITYNLGANSDTLSF